MKSRTPSRLTPREIEQYRTGGYCLPAGKVYSDDKFQRLLGHFEEKLADWPKDQRPETMDTPHFGDPALNEWALAPEVVDLVEPLLGPDILLFSTHFICKPKGDGRRVPWHEDSAYWRNLLDPMEVATVWLALDPSTVKNGCMFVIPRSHNTGKMGFSDYERVDPTKCVFETEIVTADRRDELAVPCELQPNHCSLHDARTQHGSAANTSDTRWSRGSPRSRREPGRSAASRVRDSLARRSSGESAVNSRSPEAASVRKLSSPPITISPPGADSARAYTLRPRSWSV